MAAPLALVNPFLPTRYGVSLVLNPTKPNFSGEVVLALEPNPFFHGDDLPPVLLHAADLVVVSASVDGARAAVTTNRDDETVAVVVPAGAATLSLKFLGKVATIRTFKDATRGMFRTNYMDEEGSALRHVMATHTNPQGARRVFPCIDEPSFKAVFEVSVTTDAAFEVALVMPVKASSTAGGQKTVVFEATPPMTTDVMGIVAGDFEVVAREVAMPSGTPLPVRLLCCRGASASMAPAVEAAVEALPRLETLLGTAFPLPKLDLVAVPFLSDGALENWGLTVFQSLYLEPANPERGMDLLWLVSHEMVHLWVGNYVLFDSTSAAWFNEAFATWCARKVWGRWDDEAADQTEMTLKADASAQSIAQTAGPSMNPLAYHKAMCVLEMVDQWAGVFGGVQRFLHNHRLKSVKVSDFWKCVHDASGKEVSAMVHTWVHLPGFPVVDVTAAEGKVTVVQGRYGASDDEENVPYHVPLFVPGQEVVLTDRSAVLAIPLEQFVCVNENRHGFFRVRYAAEVLPQVWAGISSGQIAGRTSEGIVADMVEFAGSGAFTNKQQLAPLLRTIEVLSQHCAANWRALAAALAWLVPYAASHLLTGNQLVPYLRRVGAAVLAAVPASPTAASLACVNSVLLLTVDEPASRDYAMAVFSTAVAGQGDSETLPGVLAVALRHGGREAYTAIREAALRGGPVADAALRALGYAGGFIDQTLKFVSQHMDVPGMDAAVAGVTMPGVGSAVRGKVWRWFVEMEKQWRSESGSPQQKTLDGMCFLLLPLADEQWVAARKLLPWLKKIREEVAAGVVPAGLLHTP